MLLCSAFPAPVRICLTAAIVVACVGTGLAAGAPGARPAPAQPPPSPPSVPMTITPEATSSVPPAGPDLRSHDSPATVASRAGSAAKAPSIVELGALGLVRVALTDLRANPSPAREDYRIALALLLRASALQPEDVEIMRLALDAAESAGDEPAREALLRKIVALDPADSASQLSLIVGRINSLQDFGARLAAYQGFLGPRGQTLDPSIRSRLALECALLHRERGEGAAFLSRLTEAAQLDPTNKDAAALAYAVFSQRVDSETGRFELLINLLTADPLDRDTHLALAHQLAAVGASRQALRFYRNTMDIDARAGEPTNLELATERSLAQFTSEGAKATLKDLDSAVKNARADVASIRRQLEEAKRPVSELPIPEDIRLDLASERLRLSAAAAAGDDASRKESAADLLASVAALDTFAADPEKMPKRLTPARVAYLRDLYRVDAPLLLLIANENVEEAGKRIDALKADAAKTEGAVPLSEAARARLEGWAAVRAGDFDAAEAAFARSPRDDAGALLGLATLADVRGQGAVARERYGAVWRGAADTYLGALARARLETLDGKAPDPAPLGAQLGAMADGIPLWIDDALQAPRKFMSINSTLLSTNVAPLEPMKITIRLRNAAPIPLRLSSDGPIESRMLLTAATEVGPIGSRSSTEVISLDRRLRLMSGEEIAVTLWADPGFGGWMMENLAANSLRSRWRLIQGFRLSGDSTVAGLNALTVDLGGATRQSLRDLAAPIDELCGKIATAKDSAFAYAVAAAQVRLRELKEISVRDEAAMAKAAAERRTVAPSATTTGGAPADLSAIPPLPESAAKEITKMIMVPALTPGEAAQVCAALAARYGREDAAGRLYLLVRVPQGEKGAGFSSAIKAVPETDETVQLAKIITRVRDAEDPYLAPLLEGKSVTAEVARLHAERLRLGATVFATMDTLAVDGVPDVNIRLDKLGAPLEMFPVTPTPGAVPPPGAAARSPASAARSVDAPASSAPAPSVPPSTSP